MLKLNMILQALELPNIKKNTKKNQRHFLSANLMSPTPNVTRISKVNSPCR